MKLSEVKTSIVVALMKSVTTQDENKAINVSKDVERQVEIIGKDAKHGKISGDAGPLGPIGIVMKKVGANPIPARKDITKMIKSDNDKFFNLFYNEYLRAGQKNIPIEKFKENYKRKDSGYLESKYLVTLMFNELKGREQKFLSLAFRYAKSISPNSSVHLKVF